MLLSLWFKDGNSKALAAYQELKDKNGTAHKLIELIPGHLGAEVALERFLAVYHK